MDVSRRSLFRKAAIAIAAPVAIAAMPNAKAERDARAIMMLRFADESRQAIPLGMDERGFGLVAASACAMIGPDLDV